MLKEGREAEGQSGNSVLFTEKTASPDWVGGEGRGFVGGELDFRVGGGVVSTSKLRVFLCMVVLWLVKEDFLAVQ